MTDISILDLFCGAGGMSVGFEKADVDVIGGIDKNEAALKTFAKNHPYSFAKQYDIRDAVPQDILELSPTGVVGGPPCKGFSDARGSRYLDDDRNGLVFEFIKWVEQIQPTFVVMENVKGILTISDDFMQAVEKEFEDIGYSSLEYKVLDSSDYGVPQSRERVILIAYADTVPATPTHPTPTHKTEKITAWNAISDLPAQPQDGCIAVDTPTNEFLQWVHSPTHQTTNHIAHDIKEDGIANKIPSRLEPGEMYRSNRFGDRYRQVWDILADEFSEIERDCFKFIANHRSKQDYRIKGKTVGHVDVRDLIAELPYSREKIATTLETLEGDGWLRSTRKNGLFGYDLNTQSGVRPRYMRITPDKPSNTILTTDFKPRDKLHPFEDRGISLREGARLQSFPDEFEFTGTFTEIATQIGNAVPPRMIECVANTVVDDITDKS